MFHQISVNGETIIPIRHGAALVASKSSPGAWHAVRLDRCDCAGFSARGRCRHSKALASYIGQDDRVSLVDDGETPTYAEWRATAPGPRVVKGSQGRRD